MGIYVNTNVTALRGQNYLQNVNNSLNTTYQRLSSGLRINSAKDDAAGLQIADRLTTQVNGLNQGNRNSNDAIALAQTIEGGLDEIGNMLQRVRTLAVQAANGTNTAEDRKALTQEASALVNEINRIAEDTTFGGKTILFGADNKTAGADSIYNNTCGSTTFGLADGKITFQVGANSGDSIELTVKSFAFSALATNANKTVVTDGASDGLTNDNLYADGTGSRTRFTLSMQCYASAAITTIDAVNNPPLQNALRSEVVGLRLLSSPD